MTGQQERTLAMARRVIACAVDRLGIGGAAPAELAGVDLSSLAQPVQALRDVVARAEGQAREQNLSTTQTSAAARELEPLRKELVGAMKTVAEVARALRREVPGIGILASVPAKVRGETLVTEAGAYARKAEIYAQTLIEHGVAANFAAQIDAATAAFKNSIDVRGASRTGAQSATHGLAAEVAMVRKLVAILNANLVRTLRSHPAALAAWKSAKRVGRAVPGGRAIAEGGVLPAPSTATVPAAAVSAAAVS